MSRILDQCLSHGPKIQLLDEQQAARSVVVSNIPPQTTDESIVIYFQRQKNGGGEIDHAHIPKKGTAFITFESSEVVETVTKFPHSLEGSQLQLRKYIPDDPPEVFGRVKARVNFGRFQLSPQESQHALKVLKDKMEVEYRDVSSKECVLYGTFNQIEAAHKLLQDIFHGDTVQTQDNSSETVFEVQPQFMKLLKRVYKTKLQEIEEEFCVKIVWSDNTSRVQIRPSKTSSNSQSYQKGCDAFIDLYQDVYPNMGREAVELKRADDETLILEAISSVEAENDVVIEKAGNKLLVYAEKTEITRSVQALKEKLGLAQGNNRKTRRGQRNLGAREYNETPQEDRFSLKQPLSNGVSFSLYQSDITDERVDAIVNAANNRLQHGGGVAAAIVRKGGRQIEDESRRIMSDRNRRSLDVGDAVHTRGGHLPCRFVIHTVGPVWKEREGKKCVSLLRRACIESLRLAAQLELCSIALPAISSGIFGMPKNICAQVMFDAVEEFSSSTEAEFSTLRDVRVVIIDDETISFFREEFVRRYTSQDTSSSPTNVTPQERPSGGQREIPPTLNSNVNSISSAERVVNPSDGTPKESREGNDNVASPNKGVGRNMENSDRREQMADDIKNGHPSNRNIIDATKISPPTGIEAPNVESKVIGTNKEKGLNSSPSVKNTETRVAKLPYGRGRGILAANFSGRPNGEVGSKESGSTQLPTKGEKKNPETWRGRGITYATTNTAPPGLTVTDEGKCLARNLGERVKDDQKNDLGAEALKEENQENTAGLSPLNQDDASGSTLPCDDKETDQKKIKKEPAERSATDAARKSSTCENTDNHNLSQPEDQTERDGADQVPVTVIDAPNDEATPLQDTSASQAAETQAMVENSVTRERANEEGLDSLEGRQDAESNKSQLVSTKHSDPVPTPFNEMYSSQETGEPKCSICMNLAKDPVYSSRCGHYFCESCWKHFIEKTKICPPCIRDGRFKGNQPMGYITWRTESHNSLPGYEDCGTIVIIYNFKEGNQGPDHPSPGQPYRSCVCTTYLPSNPTGQELCKMLRIAFDARLLFTIGKSPATGLENSIIWNGIEHKTNRGGGSANYGYPDAGYLDRLKSQLAEKGFIQMHDVQISSID